MRARHDIACAIDADRCLKLQIREFDRGTGCHIAFSPGACALCAGGV